MPRLSAQTGLERSDQPTRFDIYDQQRTLERLAGRHI